jgi:NAD(P)-dependent dehydrogenase (short-subunit alcohol dehydrogenase family)
MKLDGRVALVTGGAKRVGQALAVSLARRHAHVAFTYLTSAAEARATERLITEHGVDALAVRTDLAKPASIEQLFKRIRQRFGRLDVLVNSASNFDRVPFEQLTLNAWNRALDVNLRGGFLCAMHAVPLMRAHGGGKIVNIADWAGIRPYRDYLPYCVSKAGVIGLTKALAKELAPGILVNAIAPGPILPPPTMSTTTRSRVSRRVPVKRWGSPQDIANALLFLLEGTDFMTGSTLVIDGGQLIH